MLHATSNRGTPTTGETITKLVRQNYKPLTDEPYIQEHVQCRTEENRRKNKPEDYWNSNFIRRQSNLQKGFYSSSTEPYKPIGGQLILDPYELVLSALPGKVDIKVHPRLTRRGTVYEEDLLKNVKEKEQKPPIASTTSIDSIELDESAGFDDITQLLRESEQRMISVRAGMPYEDHVRMIEEQKKIEKDTVKPEETEMSLHSVSSMFLTQLNKSPAPDSSRQSSARSVFSPIKEGKGLMMADLVRSPSPARRMSRARPSLRPPSLKKNSDKLSLIQISSGITSVIHRKERLFRDHYLYLKSIYNMLTALHNMKVRDIRSKVPLSKDVVERLQKEHQNREDEGKSSRGTYGARFTSRQPGHPSGMVFGRRYSVRESEIDFNRDPSPRKNLWAKNLAKLSKRSNRKDAGSVMKTGSDKQESHDGLSSVFSAVKKIQAVDTINKNFLNMTRRRSRNAASMVDNKPGLETWEDLLNVQPEQYKEESVNMAFQIGVVAKFMRWYRRGAVRASENESVQETRRSGITPNHANAVNPIIDKSQLAHLQDIAEDTVDRPEKRESVYSQQQGSSQQQEKAKKLTIWQQVAQEKSTVFENSKQKAPDTANVIKRFERNLNKLKRSVQKENTAEIEKMVRERVANFRLKFGTLNSEECSPLFEEQKLKMLEVKDNVNKVHLENFDILPSKWYEELREKTLAVVSSYSQPSLMEMLAKVQTYAHMDNKTVSYAKSKLCLLMMSLPAYDICQIHIQKALKFIFEHILLGQEAQFQEWLNHRKIPYVVIKDPKGS